MFNLISCLLGLVGVILSTIFYFKSRRIKNLTFLSRSFGLLSDKTTSLPGFKAYYKNHQLDQLTATKLFLWNSGTEVIDKSDIVEKDPISFNLSPSHEIITAEISSLSSCNNNISLNLDNERNSMDIKFDYLAPREGLILNFIYTGPESVNLKAKGTIKGTGSPTKYEKDKTFSKLRKVFVFCMSITLTAGIFYFKSRTWNLSITILLFTLFFIFLLGLTFSITTIVRYYILINMDKDLVKKYWGEFSSSDFAQPKNEL